MVYPRKVDPKKFKELYNQGVTYKVIMSTFNCSMAQIYDWKRKLHLPHRVCTSIGFQYEQAAKPVLESNGFRILERGTYTSAFDYICEKDHTVYAINVQSGDHIRSANLLRLRQFGIPVIFYFNGRNWLFLKLEGVM